MPAYTRQLHVARKERGLDDDVSMVHGYSRAGVKRASILGTRISDVLEVNYEQYS